MVATKLGPSVVNIAMSGTVQGPFGQQQQYSGEGSGVIYTADGMILTNNHVVTDDNGDPVSKLEVTLATGEKMPATIVGRDPLTDLAVVKVERRFATSRGDLRHRAAESGRVRHRHRESLGIRELGDPGHRLRSGSEHRGRDRGPREWPSTT